MRRISAIVAVVGSVGALLFALGSCGGTGGTGAAVTAEQFVNAFCTADQSCLQLIVADKTLNPHESTGFTAILTDPFGNPAANERICFSLEAPDAADITEPTGGCGFTDSGGKVSGHILSTGERSGSLGFFATAESRQLRAQETILFGVGCFIDLTKNPDSTTLAAGANASLRACIECSDNTVLIGSTVNFSGCGGGDCSLSPTSGATGQDGCVTSTILNQNANPGPVQVNVTAAAAGAGSDTVNFVLAGSAPTATPTTAPEPTPTPANGGAVCALGSDCASGVCTTTTSFAGCVGSPCCTADTGDPCAADDQCKPGDTCPAGSCVTGP